MKNVLWTAELFTMLVPGILQAQQQVVDRRGWVSANLGIMTPDFVAWGINYNFGRKILYQVGLSGAEEFTLSSSVPASSMTSLNVSRGLGSLGRYHALALFGGLSVGLVDIDEWDRYDPPRATVGLYGNAQATLHPFRYFGIGIELYGYLNSVLSGAGIGVALMFGGKGPSVS